MFLLAANSVGANEVESVEAEQVKQVEPEDSTSNPSDATRAEAQERGPQVHHHECCWLCTRKNSSASQLEKGTKIY